MVRRKPRKKEYNTDSSNHTQQGEKKRERERNNRNGEKGYKGVETNIKKRE